VEVLADPDAVVAEVEGLGVGPGPEQGKDQPLAFPPFAASEIRGEGGGVVLIRADVETLDTDFLEAFGEGFPHGGQALSITAADSRARGVQHVLLACLRIF
jgi:hypothetical protein